MSEPINRDASLWYRVVSLQSLSAAWQKVLANRGAAGGDGVMISDFQSRVDHELRTLQTELIDGTYQPGPCRRVEIPKRKGGTRTLTIPSIRDRVVHSAIAETLEPVLEPLFENSSFAYRPGRSVKQAIARIEMWRDKGYCHVIEADVVQYFDAIQHELLLDKLRAALEHSPDAMRLIELIAESLDHQGGALGTLGKGLVQGSPLSPIFANLYLDALDEKMDARGVKIVRYADDFVILCTSHERAIAALEEARAVLAEHGLILHNDGTRIVSFDKGFDFIGYLFVRTLALKQDRSDKRTPETATRSTDRQTPQLEPLAQAKEQPFRGLAETYDRGLAILYLTDPTHRLTLRNESFAIHTAGGHEVAAISHNRVDRIEVGPDIALDWPVLEHCLATETDIVFVDGYGVRKGQLIRSNSAAGALQLKQAASIFNEELRCRFARKLVEARIRNQRTQLFRLNRTAANQDVEVALTGMARNLRKISAAASLEQLRGFEGASAALYWPALGQLTQYAVLPFKRSRPARDPLNAVINYLTAILERDIKAAILGADLHPGFGILHSAHDYNEAAVYDLMEPFRAPLTEGLAAFLFNAKRLRPEMFGQGDGINIRIERSGIHAIIKGYEQAVAKRVNMTGSKGKLAWRPMMQRQAYDLANAVRKRNPDLFSPYLMEP